MFPCSSHAPVRPNRFKLSGELSEKCLVVANRRSRWGISGRVRSDPFACRHPDNQIDIAIMSIGAYNPWIHSHCSPEQAIEMANAAGARFIMPVHHQTFRLSFEPFREPIERFEAALGDAPERIALREIGETFVLPM